MLYTVTDYECKKTGSNNGVGVPPEQVPVAVVTTWRVVGGEFANVLTYFHPTYTQPYGFKFYKISDATGGISLIRDSFRKVGELSPETSSELIEQHFSGDNDVLTETNGGNLLGLANDFKDEFFAGVTQTPATLWDYMVRKYGNAAGFWCNTLTGGQIINVNAQMDNVTDESCPFDKASSTGFNNVYPADLSFTGNDYGNVATVYPAYCDDDNKKQRYVMARLIFGDINPQQTNALHFDVYVQGNGGPTIDVKWKAINTDPNFSLQAVRVKMCRYWEPIAFFPEDLFTTDTHGVLVPSATAERINRYFTWSQSEHFTYMGAFQNETSNVSEPAKIAMYGVDGIANGVTLLLRFDYLEYLDNQEQRTWGNIAMVHIPMQRTDNGECSATIKSGTNYNEKYSTTVALHFEAPPDDTPPGGGGDDDDPPPPTPPQPDPPFPADEPVGFPGKAILTQTYCMGETALENIGSKLWSQSYFDVLKIQSNPIENIISCKWFPMNLSGVARSVKVGNIDFQTTGTYITDNRYISSWMEYTYTGNECTWTDPQGITYALPKYMCCSPYTRLKLHLPYAGVVELDASDFINNKLRVRFVVDLVTGDMLYFLQCGASHAPYMTVAGKMGVDIPLTATNRAQTELAIASKTLSAVIGAAGSLASGQALGAAAFGSSIVSAVGMDMTTQRTSTQSPTCASFENLAIYLEVVFPQHKASKGFAESHGYPTNLKKKLGECRGFTKVDSRTVIDVAMTEEENRMLEELLTNGIYV